MQRACSMRRRQRPTLPRSLDRSTIGAVRLNDRVRNGNGCGPDARVASKTWSADARDVPRAATATEIEWVIVRLKSYSDLACSAWSGLFEKLSYSLGSSQAARAIRTSLLGAHCGASTAGLLTS